MSKIHVNSNGEPGVCKANNGRCPFGSEADHFETPEQAEKAYESAQIAMGNSIGGPKTAIEGAVARPENLEDARKLANIIANEGKYAVVTRYSEISIAHEAPLAKSYSSFDDEYSDGNIDERDEYTDYDSDGFRSGYDEPEEDSGNEFEDWKDEVRDSSWSELEEYSSSSEVLEEEFYVRSFDSKEDIKKFSESTLTKESSNHWGKENVWNRVNAGSPEMWGKDHQTTVDFDEEDLTVSSLHQELYEPRDKK